MVLYGNETQDNVLVPWHLDLTYSNPWVAQEQRSEHVTCGSTCTCTCTHAIVQDPYNNNSSTVLHKVIQNSLEYV